MRILTLNIYKEPFEVAETGEKKNEYREPTFWIKSRLFDRKGNRKEFDLIKIV